MVLLMMHSALILAFPIVSSIRSLPAGAQWLLLDYSADVMKSMHVFISS